MKFMSNYQKPYNLIDSWGKEGKEMLFFNHLGQPDQRFRFSTDIEKIGLEWDVDLKNNTRVWVISEPMEIDRPKYGGTISVTKIKADVAIDYHFIHKEFWVPTNCLVEIQNEPLSIPLAN